MHSKQIVPFYYIRIAFLNQVRQTLQRFTFRLLKLVRIDNDQFFPPGVIGKRDTHDVVVIAGVTAPGYSEHFELHAFQLLEPQILEQRAPSRAEVMLNRIGKCEEIASRVLESVPKCNQFLPAIDGNQPAILQNAPEFFRFDAEIDYIRVGPYKWVERLDVGNCRSIYFPAMHAHGAGFAQFNGHNPRRLVNAKEQRVFLKFH